MNSRSLTALVVAASALSCAYAVAATSTKTVALRGFGTLQTTTREYAATRSSWVTFTATDPKHATLCGSKFIADLRGFGDIKPVADTNLPGTIVVLDRIAYWLVGVHGSACEVLCARSQTDLAALAKSAGASAWKPVPDAAYPPWLDCMDNAAMGFWFLGGGVLPKDVNADFAWLGENQFTGCVASGVEETRLIAPGVLDSNVLDWYGAMANKHKVPYRSLLCWTMPMQPPMLWNRSPLPYVRPADGAVPYPDMHSARLGVYDAFVPAPATDPYVLDLRRRVAAKSAEDPYFSGHHGVAELGGQTLVELSRYAGMESTTDAWHDYLRKDLGLTLVQASKRYRDNPNAYKSWADVAVPSLKDFTGLAKASLDLAGTWEGHADKSSAGTDARWFDTGAPSDWAAVRSNDPMLLEYANDAGNAPGYWLRRSFTLTADQLARFKAIHIARAGWHALSRPLAIAVYVNGHQLKDETVEHPLWPDQDQCLTLGDSAKVGENQIVVRARGPLSYIFASESGRWAYPSSNRALNQLWYDAIDFTVAYKLRSVENNLMAIRAGDPDRPIKLMAPWNVMDRIPDLCSKYGAYPHDTGQGGACWGPWMPRYVTWRGIPVSSEPGGPAGTPEDLRQHLTFYLMLGNSMVDEVFHVDQYRKPEMAKWIADNREMMRCIGKMDMPTPGIAVLRSLRSTRLGFQAPWSWDMARGEAQAVGRTADYVDLPDFAAGRANTFKVIIDDGTAVLTSADVDAIERYVRQGGTFVATNVTGMHTPDTANVWPISRLTGLAVKNPSAPFGNISFTADESLWPSLRGRELKSGGVALDWLKNNSAGTPLAQAAIVPDIKVIATWAGIPQAAGNIAIATRKIGKGTVVTIGSSFWRSAQDTNGHWVSRDTVSGYFDEFLASLGVPRESWVSGSPSLNQEVWAERWRSKNGVYDLYPVARINTNKSQPAVAADIKIRGAAADLRDLSSLGHPAVLAQSSADGFTLPATPLLPMECRVYASPRPDIERAAIYWLGVQERQWPALAPVSAKALPTAAQQAPDTIPLNDAWKMSANSDASDSWTSPTFDDRAWTSAAPATFAKLGIPEDSVVRFRRTVKLPATWRSQRVNLTFDCPYWFWGIKEQGKLWIHGTAQPSTTLPRWNNGSFVVDVTEFAKSGTVTIALEVDGHLKGSDPRRRPAGVSGTFLLQASPQPAKTITLDSWKVATDIGVFTDIVPGKTVTGKYLETTFTLPTSWPAQRLFLESPAPLRWLVLNDQIVACPDILHTLDVTGLVHRNGPNVLRWIQETNSVENPAGDHKFVGPPPPLSLSWRK
ncbi:MAG TPA: hypothetical protein VGK19_13560 [Capsulimonadaceae bacterium]|jgi:hypothetical protein